MLRAQLATALNQLMLWLFKLQSGLTPHILAEHAAGKKIARRDRHRASEPFGAEVAFDLALERSADALEHDLAETGARRCSDRRPAALGPVQFHAIAGLPLPVDLHFAALSGERAVLGRIG